MFGRKRRVAGNSAGAAPQRSGDPLQGVTRRPSGIWLTPEAHAAYEAAVRRAVQAYDKGRTAAYERAAGEAGDILDDPASQGHP